ncbi:hypothetical protein PC116_g33012 [Phytophthora cactorum]|nr:hypothetical protein PC116_g33012 [Phytophthora cactorum]
MTSVSFLAVDHAKVAVPADTNEVDDEDAVVEGDEGEVGHLDEGPDEVVGLEGGHVALGELLLGGPALHDGHARQKHPDEGRREQQLVGRHARDHLRLFVAQLDRPLQDPVPGRGGGAEDGCKKEG